MRTKSCEWCGKRYPLSMMQRTQVFETNTFSDGKEEQHLTLMELCPNCIKRMS